METLTEYNERIAQKRKDAVADALATAHLTNVACDQCGVELHRIGVMVDHRTGSVSYISMSTYRGVRVKCSNVDCGWEGSMG